MLLVGFIMAFGICQYISYIIEMKTYGSAELTTLYTLTHPQITESTNLVGTLFSYVNAGWDFMITVLNMLTWNYAFFDGWVAIFRYLIFIPISVGMVWAIVSLIRGTSSE